jgi:hypothetical protein
MDPYDKKNRAWYHFHTMILLRTLTPRSPASARIQPRATVAAFARQPRARLLLWALLAVSGSACSSDRQSTAKGTDGAQPSGDEAQDPSPAQPQLPATPDATGALDPETGLVLGKLVRGDGLPYPDYSRIAGQLRVEGACTSNCVVRLVRDGNAYFARDVPEGGYTLEFYWVYNEGNLQIQKPYAVPDQGAPRTFTVEPDAWTDLGLVAFDLPTEAHLAVHGVARDEHGAELANTEIRLAYVIACDQGDMFTGTGQGCGYIGSSGDRTVSTDAHGSFSFSNVQQWMYVLYIGSVDAPGSMRVGKPSATDPVYLVRPPTDLASGQNAVVDTGTLGFFVPN